MTQIQAMPTPLMWGGSAYAYGDGNLIVNDDSGPATLQVTDEDGTNPIYIEEE